MGRLVRVFKGQWSKNQQGIWKFEEDEFIGGRDILVGMTEPIQSLINMVRGVFYISPMTPLILTFQLPPWMIAPDGEVIPPQNIVSNADIEVMMNVHKWNVEPKLCIMYGAESVARYHFICRSPFTLGDRTFLGEGITEEEHLASIKAIMGGVCFRCTMRMLSQIYNEDKAVELYRFAMEIDKAQNVVDLNVGPADDNDDHIVPTFEESSFATAPAVLLHGWYRCRHRIR
ncbi:hypothetical protein Bca4012_067371 [Brassica carinata]